MACSGALLALSVLGSLSRSGVAAADATAARPAQTAAASPAAATTPPMTAAQVIAVLDQTVDWYRTLGLQQQAANEPSDLLILYDNRQTASRVMALAFDIARADAEMLDKQPPIAAGDAGTALQTLSQLRNKIEVQSAAVETALDGERRMHASAKNPRSAVLAKLNELQGELDLINTKKSILSTMAGLASGPSASNAGALKAQIEAMAVAIPAAGNVAPATATGGAITSATAPLASPAVAVGRFGLWDLASTAFRLSEKTGTIDSIDRRTVALQNTMKQIENSILDQIKALSARGDALSAAADSTDVTTLNSLRGQLDLLSDQFKQASALLIPLGREGILLSQYRHNLNNWREAIRAQYRGALETLGIRSGVLLIILALLFAAAEIWERAVLRYIQDTRRRYQLLLLRRIGLWSLVVVVIGFAFASELGSIATFAGLITAGIAVAMQSVLVSIVGYFFLIGKYGIRVGDRVQIGEVAGEVIDLGLVRMYLMELGAKGAMGPTGRVVAFANSVVFQVSGGLFKQIPGVNFSWREVILNLPAGSDLTAVKATITAALGRALEKYLPEIQRQTREIERTTLSSSAAAAEPQVQLHFAGGSVEAHVRYPVNLAHAAEIDERVTGALADVLSSTTGSPPMPVR